ncbi:dTDP-4-dehydrorhamnose 3,5-epimerase family protein [Acidobacteriota bacterium]
MIEGVKIKQLRVIPDERGRLMEILRSDDKEFFSSFGQVYVTTTYPGVVKAWHYHELQDDNFACIHGMVRVALYDARAGSPTCGEVQEIFMGEHNPLLVHIPKGVYHGWKCAGEKEAIVVNCPTQVYNYSEPDEKRVHPHDNDIPYDWNRQIDG